MNARLKEVLYWLVLIAPLGLMLSLMPNIPSVIPLHYNFSGEVTRYGSKYEMLILPVIGIAIAVTLNLLSRSLAKKSERGLQNGKILVQIGFILSVCFGALSLAMLYFSSINTMNINETAAIRIITFVLGVMFLFMGNLMPKCKRMDNPWHAVVGLRTPWTLRDDEVWAKTNRLGGYCMVGIGFLGIALSFILSNYWSLMILCALVFLLAIAGTIYSWHLYRRIHPNE